MKNRDRYTFYNFYFFWGEKKKGGGNGLNGEIGGIWIPVLVGERCGKWTRVGAVKKISQISFS